MVAVEPVFDTMVDQIEPPSVDLSILYPVIAEPPLFDGALQLRLICDDEAVVAASPVGGCGAPARPTGKAGPPRSQYSCP